MYKRNTTTCWSIFDFVKRVEPKQVELVHYSGYEDKHHNQDILIDDELRDWTEHLWLTAAGPSPSWNVPKPGQSVNPIARSARTPGQRV